MMEDALAETSVVKDRPHPVDQTSVVIVIPTLNEAKTIGFLLEDFAEAKAKLPKLEIVVADGGSTDATVSIVKGVADRFPFVHLVNNPKRIQSAGVNLVARQWGHKAEVMIRCDAHSAYPVDFALHLIDTLHRTGADSVVVPMDSVGRNCVEKAVGWVSDTPVGSGGSAHRGGKASGFVDHGHHAAFRLSCFLSVGGYDETFTHNEDAEFDCRLNASGGRVYLDADIRIAYHPRDRLTRLWRQYFNYGKGRSRTIRRHPGTMRLRQLAVPCHFVFSLLSLIAAGVTGYWLLLAWPVTYALILAVASASIAIKQKSACGLLAGPAAFTMHTSWACGFISGLIFKRQAQWTPVLNPVSQQVS